MKSFRKLVSFLRNNTPSGLGWEIKASHLSMKYGTEWKSKIHDLDITVRGIRKFSDNPIRWLQVELYQKIAQGFNLLWVPVRFLTSLERALAYAVRGWKSPDYDHGYLTGDIVFKLERMLYEVEHHDYHEDTTEVKESLIVAIAYLKRSLDYDLEEGEQEIAFKDALRCIETNYQKWWT